MKKKTNEKALSDLLQEIKGTPGSHYLRDLLLSAAELKEVKFPQHIQNFDPLIKSIIKNLSYDNGTN
jgi:hypothetical protein